jgi:NhaP-type Na+/H+ or K+/H+ antiporter
VLVGGLLTSDYLPRQALWFVPLLLILIRPISIVLGLAGTRLTGMQRGWIAWFGVRGVGSIYYLMFALERGVEGESATLLTGLTLTTVAASIVLHGISVTPMMKAYDRTIRGSRT